MALVLKDRVREISTSSGTGSITLAGAYTGYQSFNTAIASGSTVYYTIKNTTPPNDGEWEVGVGTFTAPSTLSRDAVFSSSTGGTKVSFSSGSDLEVFVTQPSEQAVYINDATGKVEVFGNGTNVVTFTEINTTNLTASTVTLTAGTITTNAANGTDITNKQYVDGLFSTGISYHAPVRVESPTALSPVTYNNGSSGVGATLTNAGTQTALVIDGITVSLNDRVLIYTQTDQKQNGVYTVTNVGSGSTNWVLTRATDADSFGLADPNQLGQGDAFFVQQGNTGAGETYVCNTPGTIVFGTTNITFAQISSVQVYSAGTGLNLSNLTFSIANTAVTAATYGNAGAVATFTVNAQGQITNAANVAINASSITVGTLANARTTASDANGASTIVARDATGSFTANTITATTVNATSGNFTNIAGNAAALTAINASNISSGTISNARTTASTSNSANTIVSRDANGSFGANIISASFSGDGSAINAINASNISSGTIANARTTAASANGASTIVLRDSGGSFDVNTVNAVSLVGNASQVTAINASNISSGTIANARTTASSSNGASTIVLRGASGEFAAGAITGSSFSGNGSALTAINASAITTGTIDNARTTAASANGASTIVARDAGGNFSANTITATTFSGAFSGNGSTISAINASNISSGTIANARTTASDANGASTIVARDANGSFTANIITANGSAISAINGSNVTTGTIANARTTAATANGASTIVLRGTSGEFSAGAITGASFTGSGAALSSINASNISSGTIDNARTTAASANGASTIVARDASGNFTGNVITATTFSGGGGSISAINASNISTGTIANARTTAASANGASTIVTRDANGDFSARTITASLSGTATTGTNWGSYGAVPAAGTSFGNANTIGRSDANGYTYFNYINSNTANNENPGISQIITTNGSDNFYRKASVAHLGASLTSLNASNISSGTLARARLPSGTILQVVSTTKTDTFSTSGIGFVDVTGLSVSITPTTTSSRIFITASVCVGPIAGASGGLLRFVRNSTVIDVGDAAGVRPLGGGGFYSGDTSGTASWAQTSMVFVDSPSTTSATTYKIQFTSSTGSPVYINRTARDENNASGGYDPRLASTITVMEIA